jgi:hypothetical protein
VLRDPAKPGQRRGTSHRIRQGASCRASIAEADALNQDRRGSFFACEPIAPASPHAESVPALEIEIGQPGLRPPLGFRATAATGSSAKPERSRRACARTRNSRRARRCAAVARRPRPASSWGSERPTQRPAASCPPSVRLSQSSKLSLASAPRRRATALGKQTGRTRGGQRVPP